MKTDREEIRRGFEKAYNEAGDVSVETDVDDQQRARRQRELDNWDVETGRGIAASEGIELDDEHLAVVEYLRSYYLDNGPVEHGRELGDLLETRFADAGGRKYLRRLFPEGPVSQGMKIAGLPVPDNTEDAGFGTAR